MKKILVATDASEYSRKALKTALDLAQKYNVEIELLFVIHDPVVYSIGVAANYIAPPEQLERDAEFALDATLAGIETNGVTIKRKILHGNPGNVIIHEAANEDIDLVVLGSHGYGAIASSLLGSVSQKVLHGAKCSVLIVK